MSFSGLTTAMLRARDGVVAEKQGLTNADQADLSAGFQSAITDVLVEKSRRAIDAYLKMSPETPTLAVAGGVAANTAIRTGLQDLCASRDVAFIAPPLALCTDNAAMIAYVGLTRLGKGEVDDLTLSARPRWPLDNTAAPMLGSGKKGAKA
jgi:N6-L-threonylcarbamoyladenine synthase